MFGFSLGEIMILLIVGIVVVGPRNLPGMMRTLGQWIAKLRRMSTDLRSQSGIDDLIRHEGLEREIQELRSLSRMNMVESIITPALRGGSAHALGSSPSSSLPSAAPFPTKANDAATQEASVFLRKEPLREREYPVAGCDAAGAQPDDALFYAPETPETLEDADLATPATEEAVSDQPDAQKAGESTEARREPLARGESAMPGAKPVNPMTAGIPLREPPPGTVASGLDARPDDGMKEGMS